MTGEYKVLHFDGKADAGKYMDSINLPVTHLYTAFYYENLTGIMKARPGQDGSKTFCFPQGQNVPIPTVHIGDIAKAVVHCLNKQIKGKYFIASEFLTGEQIAVEVSKATGQNFIYYGPSFEEYRNYGFPGAVEIGNMYEWWVVHSEEHISCYDQ